MALARSTIFRFAALVFLLQLAGAGLLLGTVRLLTHHQITAEAEAQADDLRGALIDDYRRAGLPVLAAEVGQALSPARAQGRVLLLVDGGGQVLAGNLAEWPPSLAPGGSPATLELFRVGRDESERIYASAVSLDDGARLLVGHVVESELRFTLILEEAMVGGVAVAIALAAFAAWAAARLIHRRLAATVDTARAVTAGDLARRVPVDHSEDVFDALGVTINQMLDRIDALMTELKIATDGLAHDLRSPLTRLRSTLERALEASESDEARGSVARAIDEGDRLLAMLDTALRISRAEAGLGRDQFVAIDLAVMVEDLVEVYGPLAEDNGFEIVADIAGPVPAHVHRELLGQALANLIDNAMKYGAGRITVSARRAVDEAIISVTDQGDGIAETQRTEALRRFGRLDAARSKAGAGLGLALAAAVAHLHGGRLELGDNAPGLRVDLRLHVEERGKAV